MQENHQIEQVWVSFHTFWGLTFLMDEKCKITETHAFLDMGAFACILYHVSTQEISSLNSPNSGIGLFYADSGFFDGKNLDFWRIGSKPFLWRILKTGEKAICRHVTEPLCISQREKVKRGILSCRWSVPILSRKFT
jgi:hypothetical protein